MPKPLIFHANQIMELLNKAKNEQLKRIKKLDARAQELLEKTKECESNINLLKDINNG